MMRLFFFAAALLTMSAACGLRKKVVYFQGNDAGTDTILPYTYVPVYHVNDLLSVTVSAMDAEAVKPFNTNVVAYTSEDGRVSNVPMQQGYFVDSSGMIDLPVLGQIRVGGLSRSQATKLIRDRLNTYVVNPIVTVKILNYKITVLGDVKAPGTFQIPGERVTLPEALGMAGDMNITGQRTNILVIRDLDGKKTEYRIDLTKKECYNSPAYYLMQNDIVYVEPNKARRSSSAVGTNAGIIVSVTSLILTTVILLTR